MFQPSPIEMPVYILATIVPISYMYMASSGSITVIEILIAAVLLAYVISMLRSKDE
jgi:hypothetical protein